MEPQARKNLQLVLIIFLVLVAIRFALIYRSRHETGSVGIPSTVRLDADYYVVPKKLHPYNLESARELTQQPAWVKEGYKFTYYPYDAMRKRADFDHEAGTLGPIEKLQVKDVVQQDAPRQEPQVFQGSQGQPIRVRQEPSQFLLAVFEKGGKGFALPIGRVRSKNYSIYSDEIFFIQDPRELYKHWTPEVWQAIEKHEIMPGMNEIQATFAVGMGQPQAPGEDASQKVVRYPNGGKPLVVTYRDGKAQEIKQSS